MRRENDRGVLSYFIEGAREGRERRDQVMGEPWSVE